VFLHGYSAGLHYQYALAGLPARVNAQGFVTLSPKFQAANPGPKSRLCHPPSGCLDSEILVPPIQKTRRHVNDGVRFAKRRWRVDMHFPYLFLSFC